jgi:glycosyltransferase involved in cell wall biosynthesis
VIVRAYAGRVIWTCHDTLRDWVYSHARLARDWRPPRGANAIPGTVLHVTTSFDLGGTQTQIKNLCTFQRTRYQHEATEMFPEFNFLYRQGVTIDAGRYREGGSVARRLGRYVVDLNPRSSQLVQIYKLVRDFEVVRPAVVVGWGHEICVTTFVAAAIARVPHIVFCIRTFNPLYGWTDEPFGRLLQRAHRRMLPQVSQVIANSTWVQRDYAEWAGIDRARVAVCPNGISVSSLSPSERAEARARVRSEHCIAQDTTVVVNVGRFSREKGQMSLVEANRLLRDRQGRDRIAWLLCGDGPTMPDVKAKAEEYGLTNMMFIGRTQAVGDMLSASDIFVMPSDFEGMPNAMMEAMAAGLPCVSTTRSGAIDVARDGIEALYYEARDAEQLANHLDTLINNPTRASELGAAAAERIKKFDMPTFVNNFEAILDGVLGSR